MEMICALLILAAFAGFVIYSQDRQIDDWRYQNAELLDRLLEKKGVKPLLPPIDDQLPRKAKASDQPPRGFLTLEDADEVMRDWVEEQVWSQIYNRNFESGIEKESAIRLETKNAIARYYEEYPDRKPELEDYQ